MRWTKKTQQQLHDEFHAYSKTLREWHIVFAFKPIEVSPGKFVWFERVLRRADYSGNDYKLYRKRFIFFKDKRLSSYTLNWQYKTDIFEILKEE